MDSSVEYLVARIAALEERFMELATARRAQRTSVREGYTEWLPGSGGARIRIGADDPDGNVTLTVVDTLGRDAIVIGTRTDGSAYIRALNPDGEMDAFSITAGQGSFPPALAGWMRRLNDASLDWNGAPPTNSPVFQMLWSTMLPITSPYLYAPNIYAVEADTTAEFRMQFTTVAPPVSKYPPGAVGAQQSVGPVAFGAGSGSNAFSSLAEPDTGGAVVEIPMIWDPPRSMIGSTLIVTLEGRITSGPGVAKIYPLQPLMCVDL